MTVQKIIIHLIIATVIYYIKKMSSCVILYIIFIIIKIISFSVVENEFSCSKDTASHLMRF